LPVSAAAEKTIKIKPPRWTVLLSLDADYNDVTYE